MLVYENTSNSFLREARTNVIKHLTLLFSLSWNKLTQGSGIFFLSVRRRCCRKSVCSHVFHGKLPFPFLVVGKHSLEVTDSKLISCMWEQGENRVHYKCIVKLPTRNGLKCLNKWKQFKKKDFNLKVTYFKKK